MKTQPQSREKFSDQFEPMRWQAWFQVTNHRPEKAPIPQHRLEVCLKCSVATELFE